MDSSLDDSATAATPGLPSGDDLSALAWVQEELRRSLDAAHKSLRRFIKDLEAVTGSDLDSVDPGVLRTARSQIHQGVGALELVGLPARGGGAARQRVRGAEEHRPAAGAHPGAGHRHRALVVRPARLPGAHPRRQERLLAVAVPAVPRGAGSGRGRARPSGRPLGDGLALARDRERSERRAAHRRRRLPHPDGSASAAADARHAGADRLGEDERAVGRARGRLRRIRRCAPSGTSPRRCSRPSTTACCRSTSSPSASPRACWRSSAS